MLCCLHRPLYKKCPKNHVFAKYKKNNDINKQKCYYRQSKNFSGTVRSDTVRHLKTFRIISNEMPVLHLILRW